MYGNNRLAKHITDHITSQTQPPMDQGKRPFKLQLYENKKNERDSPPTVAKGIIVGTGGIGDGTSYDIGGDFGMECTHKEWGDDGIERIACTATIKSGTRFWRKQKVKIGGGGGHGVNVSTIIKEEGNHQDDIAHQFPGVNATTVFEEPLPPQQ